MQIKHFLLESFEIPASERKPINSIIVPEGSVLLQIKPLPDGIYAWYEVPEIEIGNNREDKFVSLGGEMKKPDNAEFITIIDLIVPTGEDTQGVMIIPIYRLHDKPQTVSIATKKK